MLTRRGGGKGAGVAGVFGRAGFDMLSNELFSPRGVTKFLRGRKFVTAECGDQLARKSPTPAAPSHRLGGSETRATRTCRLAARYPGSYQGPRPTLKGLPQTPQSSEYPPRAHGPIHTTGGRDSTTLTRVFLRDSFRRCGGAPLSCAAASIIFPEQPTPVASSPCLFPRLGSSTRRIPCRVHRVLGFRVLLDFRLPEG